MNVCDDHEPGQNHIMNGYSAIILKHISPLAQEIEALRQYKAVAKELADSESCTYCKDKGFVADGMGGHNLCPCRVNPRAKFNALTKFNILKHISASNPDEI